MPIQFSCTCGKQLRTKEENAGKRVKCPGCGEAVAVPKPRAAPAPATAPAAAPSAADKIRFQCDCGKQLQARAEFAGKKTRCPACGEMVPIPGGDAIKPAKAAPARSAAAIKAQPKPAIIEEEEDWEQEEEEETPKKKRGGRSRLPLILGMVVGLLLLVGGAGAAVYFFLPDYLPEFIRPAPKPVARQRQGRQVPPAPPAGEPDLDLVLVDAPAFGSVRVADLLASQTGKKIQEEVAKAGIGSVDQLTQMIGVAPAAIERASLVVSDPVKKSAYVIIATAKPYDRAKILAAPLFAAAKETPYKGKSYHAFTDPENGKDALYFVSDRIVLVGDEATIQKLIDQPPQPGAKGKLSEAVNLARAKHHLVVAATPPDLVPKEALSMLPPPAQPFKPVAEVVSTLVTADVRDELEVDVTLTYADEAKAKAAQAAAEAAKKPASEQLTQLKQLFAKPPAPDKPPPPEAARLAKPVDARVTMLQTPVEQNGPVVHVHIKTPPGTLASALNFLGPIIQSARKSAVRADAQNNLKQIGLALHIYHQTYGHFPPAVVYSPDGKPIYSWRVAILPFLDAELKGFKMDEPWDSPNNMKFVASMPKVFANPDAVTPEPGQTFVKLFTGPGAAFDGKKAPKLTDFTQGSANAILAAEVGAPVPWTKPVDVAYDKDKPLPPLFGPGPAGFNALMADGSVQRVSGLSEAMLRAMIEPGKAK